MRIDKSFFFICKEVYASCTLCFSINSVIKLD